MRPRLALLLLIGPILPAGAQSPPVTPLPPPPLRYVCAVGPSIADFCELRVRVAPGGPCTCPGPDGPRRGRAELR